jgi:hypothetical protein
MRAKSRYENPSLKIHFAPCAGRACHIRSCKECPRRLTSMSLRPEAVRDAADRTGGECGRASPQHARSPASCGARNNDPFRFREPE